MQFKLLCCLVALVMLLAVPSAAQWQFAYQMEKDLAFHSVHFPTSSVGYAVGSSGSIYKSTDSGDSWTEQTSPVSATLYEVFFLNSTDGWAVGASGTIISTTDGTNWTVHDSSGVMTTLLLRDVEFIGSDGWITGDNGTVFYSTDGGVAWTIPTTVPHTDEINAIAMVNASLGYAVADGDGIMYTTDGGVNWIASTVNLGLYPYTRTDIEVVMVIDDTTAVASGWGSLVGLQPTIIVVTEDAGVTWNSPDPTGYHWDTYGYGYGLAMFGDGEVILTGGGSGCAGFLHHSTDNGATWTNTAPFSGEDTRAACVVPGTDRVVVVGDEGMFALSTDKGQTWSFYFDPGTGFAGWHDIAHLSSDRVFISGANGHVLEVAQDASGEPTGGYNFLCASPENLMSTILTDIDFAPGTNDMYVSGNYGYLCKSSDFGQTWRQLQHTATTTTAIYQMWWFDATNAVLVGEIGSQETIWTTPDGGENINIVWSDSTGTNLQFNSVSFAPDNPLIGAVCGDDTAMVYTTDGGSTWDWANTGVVGSKPDLEQVHMVSATVGWCVGDAGTVLKTVDGGANWTVQANPATSLTLMDVQFADASHPGYGWISGDNQTVFYTDDNGLNWTAANPTLNPTGKDVNAIHFQRVAGTLWIGVDDGDALYRRNDVTTVIRKPISLPYTLGQNYPNPFNPSTSIDFSLPNDDHVTLNIYDVRGRLVAKVLNKGMEAGDHTVFLDASDLASGVYFYTLSSSSGTQTRKMVLLR